MAQVYFPSLTKIKEIPITNDNRHLFAQMRKDRGIYTAGWRSITEALLTQVAQEIGNEILVANNHDK